MLHLRVIAPEKMRKDVLDESALQLAVNLVGIVIAGVLVLVLRPKGTLIARVVQT